MRKIVPAMVVSALLAGCATSYQKNSFTGGYTDLKLSADTYRITVNGNGYTSNSRAENIALLRAAELTLQDGFDRFVILSGGVQQQNAGSTPVVVNRIGRSLIASGGDTITKPEGGLVFRMVKKDDPAFASALDAKLIQGQLREQLVVT